MVVMGDGHTDASPLMIQIGSCGEVLGVCMGHIGLRLTKLRVASDSAAAHRAAAHTAATVVCVTERLCLVLLY